MLVIDKENDRALLSRQSRFVPRMWSCLAGFIEVRVTSSLMHMVMCSVAPASFVLLNFHELLLG